MRKKIWLIMVGIVILTLMSASIVEAGMFNWITGAPVINKAITTGGAEDGAEAPSLDPTAENPQCSDGTDNDDDGFIDFEKDPGCSSPDDDSEEDEGAEQVDCCDCWKEGVGFDLAFCPDISTECTRYKEVNEQDPYYFDRICGEEPEEKEKVDCCECVDDMTGEFDLDNCPDLNGKAREYCAQWAFDHNNYFGKGICYEDEPNEEPPQLSPWECENKKDDDNDGQIDFKGGCDLDGDKVIDLIAQECVDIGDYYLPDDCCESFKDDSEAGYIITYGVECSDGLDNDVDGTIDFAGACRVDEVIYNCDNRQQFPSTSEADCYLAQQEYKTCAEVAGKFIKPDTNCLSPFFDESTEVRYSAPSSEGFEEENEGFFARLAKIFQ